MSRRRRMIRRKLELERLRRVRRKSVPAYRNCRNCGTVLKGMYCHNCGQYALDTEQPFWKYILQYFENVYQFDGKLWVTLRMLFCRPGFLTNEFNAGKIVSYVHPMRLLMFITVVFFLGFFMFVDSKIDKAEVSMDGKLADISASQACAFANRDSCVALVADSAELALVNSTLELMEIKDCIPGAEPGKDTLIVMLSPLLLPEMNCVETGNRDGVPLYEKRAFGSKGDLEAALFRERLMGMAASYAPLVALLLTPFMALLFMVFYRRCRIGYMGHFVFSLHFASFFYLMLAAYIAVGEVWKYSGLPWYVFSILLLVYAVVASHRVYRGTGWAKAIVKTLLLFFTYGCAVLAILVFLVVLAVAHTGSAFTGDEMMFLTD